jgi:hypothetical protein
MKKAVEIEKNSDGGFQYLSVWQMHFHGNF